MNAHAYARQSYASSAQAVKTPRNIEFTILARVTKNLQVNARKRKSDFPNFVQALEQNRQLWAIFANDLADSGNQLSPDLKQNLTELADFTHRHTMRVLTQKASVKPLLEINASVLRGLQDGAKT